MSRLFRNTVFWCPAFFRAALYCTLAYWVAFDSSFEQLTAKLNSEEVAKWGRIEWLRFGYLLMGKPVIAALLVLKGFMDDSWSKLREKSDTMHLARNE